MSYREENNQVVLTHSYRWNRMGRKGQPCRVLVRGKMNSCLVEFADGFRAVISRNALQKRLNQGSPNYTPYEVAKK